MKPSLTFLAILNLVGAAQGLLLTLALLRVKGGNKTANRLLAALTLTISIVVGGAVLVSTNYVFVLPQLSRLHHPFVFLAGPLLFLYIKALTTGEQPIAKKDFFTSFRLLFVCSICFPISFRVAPPSLDIYPFLGLPKM